MTTVGMDELDEVFEDLGIAGEAEVGRAPVGKKDININAAYEKGKLRVQALLFSKEAETADGEVTLTARAQRPCKPIKLIVELYKAVDSVAFGFISGLRSQGINQCLSAGFGPVTAFAPNAPAEDLPWNFAPLSSGGDMEVDVTLLGISSETVYVTALAKVIAAQA